MAYALEHPDHILIMDDIKARKLAENLALKITGTVGVIIKAKKRKAIPSIKPLLEAMNKTDFHISDELLKHAIGIAGE